MKVFLIPVLFMILLPSRGQHVLDQRALWFPPHIDWPATKTGKLAMDHLAIAGFSVVLDQTLLENARKHFGAVIGSRGNAGDAESWLCLRGSDSNGAWIFWLTSEEINGDAVGGFIWKRLKRGQSPDARCRSVHGQNAVRLLLPLQLGMTKAEALKLSGTPTSDHGESVFFMHERHEKIHSDDYSIDNGLEITIEGGKVEQIAAFEISSN